MVAAGVHRGGPGGHVAEDGGQVKILEGAPPEDPGRYLAGDGQDRRLVELGVVQAGEHVGRARPRDRETGRGPAGELAVRAGREGRRSVDRRQGPAALARLPPRRREVVVLRYYLGLSETEIATVLGISAGTVKSTAARALAALARDLGETQ